MFDFFFPNEGRILAGDKFVDVLSDRNFVEKSRLPGLSISWFYLGDPISLKNKGESSVPVAETVLTGVSNDLNGDSIFNFYLLLLLL